MAVPPLQWQSPQWFPACSTSRPRSSPPVLLLPACSMLDKSVRGSTHAAVELLDPIKELP